MSKSDTSAVARVWRGRTISAVADQYETYLFEHGVKKLQAMGAERVQMFREDRAGESEFMVTSYWPTLESMTSWAGSDPRHIRHLPRDAEMLIELPETVQILKIKADM